MASQHYGEYESELFGEMEEELAGAHEATHEDELEQALQGSLEDELGFHETHHEGEEFFGKAFKQLARGIGGFIKRAAPILRTVARVAAPMVATAVGGPLGGILGKVATSALGEDELEAELAGFGEVAHEDELGFHELGFHELLGKEEMETHEHHELGHELAHEHHEVLPELGGHHEHHETHELHEAHEIHHEAVHEMMAEMMAEVAAGAQTEAEAEAMIGAASVSVLSARDRAALRRLLPHLVRGVAVLTRILRRRRITRPAVRTVPVIMRQTVRTLRQRAASGLPVTRRVAGQVMGQQTRRILGNPRLCGLAIQRNLRSTAQARSAGRTIAG
jgi:hypothetical protein